MAKYRLRTACYLGGTRFERDDVIEWSGPPSASMEPLDAEARAAVEEYANANRRNRRTPRTCAACTAVNGGNGAVANVIQVDFAERRLDLARERFYSSMRLRRMGVRGLLGTFETLSETPISTHEQGSFPMIELPRYRVTVEHAYIGHALYTTGDEVTMRCWPDRNVEPINDSALRVTEYHRRRRASPTLPNSPYNKLVDAIYLPAVLPPSAPLRPFAARIICAQC